MVKRVLKRFAHRVRGFLLEPLLEARAEPPPIDYPRADAASQRALILAYHRLLTEGKPLPPLSEVGFKVYSQTDEDGILLYIFALIGTTNRRCVEICAGDGRECNTANLIINHRWLALLFDGHEQRVERGRSYYKRHPATFVYPPTFVHAWITSENVNELIEQHGFRGEIDLLSLDLDGVDYWVWQAIDVIAPRVVVLEYQDILGPERSWTVPNKADFSARDYPRTRGMPNFAGASLTAFVKLGREKGYRLVGCNTPGYNAFFVRQGLGEEQLPEIPIESCFQHPKVLSGMEERFPTVKDLPWVEV